MLTLGNLIWLLFSGLWSAIAYSVSGALLCCTIIGIPFGMQAFKLAAFTLWPFGRKIVEAPGGGGCLSTGFNIVWLVLFGWGMCVGHLISGALMCLTIIGIPFGMQAFKLAFLALWPFGREIVEE